MHARSENLHDGARSAPEICAIYGIRLSNIPIYGKPSSRGKKPETATCRRLWNSQSMYIYGSLDSTVYGAQNCFWSVWLDDQEFHFLCAQNPENPCKFCCCIRILHVAYYSCTCSSILLLVWSIQLYRGSSYYTCSSSTLVGILAQL